MSSRDGTSIRFCVRHNGPIGISGNFPLRSQPDWTTDWPSIAASSEQSCAPSFASSFVVRQVG